MFSDDHLLTGQARGVRHLVGNVLLDHLLAVAPLEVDGLHGDQVDDANEVALEANR